MFRLYLARDEEKITDIMSKKLYVGNISFNTSDQELGEHFEQIGNVESVKIIEDFETGRSRGFGFVEMYSKQEAEKAIEELDGTELDGRELKVDEARPRRDNNNGGGKNYGFRNTNRW